MLMKARETRQPQLNLQLCVEQEMWGWIICE